MPELKRKKVELAVATLIVAAVLGATATLSPVFLLTLIVTGGLWALMFYEAIGAEGWWRRNSISRL